MTQPKPKVFIECGCCSCWHPQEFTGDCRDDKNRFTLGELLKKYPDADYIPLEDQEEE